MRTSNVLLRKCDVHYIAWLRQTAVVRRVHKACHRMCSRIPHPLLERIIVDAHEARSWSSFYWVKIEHKTLSHALIFWLNGLALFQLDDGFMTYHSRWTPFLASLLRRSAVEQLVLWTTNSARVRIRSPALSVSQLCAASPIKSQYEICLGINEAKSPMSNDGHLLLQIQSPMCNRRFIPFCRSNTRSRWASATSMFDKALYNSSLPDAIRLHCRYIISLDTKSSDNIFCLHWRSMRSNANLPHQ